MDEELKRIIQEMQAENKASEGQGGLQVYSEDQFKEVISSYKLNNKVVEKPNGPTAEIAPVGSENTATSGDYTYGNGLSESVGFKDESQNLKVKSTDETQVSDDYSFIRKRKISPPKKATSQTDIEVSNVRQAIGEEGDIDTENKVETELVNEDISYVGDDNDPEYKLGDDADPGFMGTDYDPKKGGFLLENVVISSDKDIKKLANKFIYNQPTYEPTWIDQAANAVENGLNTVKNNIVDSSIDIAVWAGDAGEDVADWTASGAKYVVKEYNEIKQGANDIWLENFAPGLEVAGNDLVNWWNEVLESTHKGAFQYVFPKVLPKWDMFSGSSIEENYDEVYTNAAMDKKGGNQFLIDWDPTSENNPANIDNHFNADNYVVARPGSQATYDENFNLIGIWSPQVKGTYINKEGYRTHYDEGPESKYMTLKERREIDLREAKSRIQDPEHNSWSLIPGGGRKNYQSALTRELKKIHEYNKKQGWIVVYKHNKMPVGSYHQEWKVEQYQATQKLKSEMKDIDGSYVEFFKTGDPSQFFNATGQLLSSLLTTLVPSVITGGVSIFPQVTSVTVVNYNIQKAAELYPSLTPKEGVEMLILNEQEEVLIPTIIGTAASAFELVGFKGITTAIQMAKMSGIKKTIGLALASGFTEGTTEWCQHGAEAYSRSMASTTHIEDMGLRNKIAAEAAVNAMYSEEGLEMFIMGAFGGSFMTGTGGMVQRYMLRDKASFTYITSRISKIGLLREKLLASVAFTKMTGKPTTTSVEVIQKEIDELASEIETHIESVGRKASLLTKEELEGIKKELLNINSKYGEIQKLEYEFFFNLTINGKNITKLANELDLSLDQCLKEQSPSHYEDYIVRKKALAKEYDDFLNNVETVKNNANKRLIKKGITFAIGKVGEDNIAVFKTKAELTAWFNENKDEKTGLVGGTTLEEYLRADGAVVKLKDGSKVIVINREQAIKLNAISVAQHEVFHFVFGKLLRDSDGKMTAEGVQLVKDFLDKLSPRARVLIENKVARNYNVKVDTNGDLINLNIYEEYLAAYVDARVKNEISREESISALNFIKKRSINSLKNAGYENAKFTTADDVQNWLESYIDDYKSNDSNVERVKAEKGGTSSTMMSNTDLEPIFNAIAENQTQETWDATGSQKAINWMFGKFDNLIGSTITQQMRDGENWTSDEDYIMDVYVKLIPYVRRFNDGLWGTKNENDSLWGWIVPWVRTKGWDVLKDNKVKPKTKETPLSLDDDATFVDDVESSEYVDINAIIEDNITFTKLKNIFGIKRDGPIHLKLKEWIGTKIGIIELSKLDTVEFKKELKKYFKAILFDDLKGIIGTPGSTKYKNWIRNNGEALYNLLPQEIMNNQYSDFIIKGKENISSLEVDQAIKDGLLPKGTSRTSGPTLYTKKPYAEIEQDWIDGFLNPVKGRPASKQNSLLDLVSWFLGFDATMEVINTKEFKEANDVAMITIATIGMKIDRGADVMFSNSNGDDVLLSESSGINGNDFIQKAGDMARWVSKNVGFDDINPTALISLLNTEFPNTDSRIIDLIVSLSDTEAIKNSDSEQFKVQVLKKLKELGFDETINDIKQDGTVKYSEAAQERIYNTAVILAHKFGPRIMKVLGWEILGFKNGVLDPAKTKKDANGVTIPGAQGKYYKKLEALKLAIQNQSNDQLEDRVVIPKDLNLTDTRKMNKAFALFKKIEKILFDGTSTGKFETNLEWKKNEIAKMAEEITAAGKANIELAKLTAKTIIESGLDHASVIHLLQIQTSITSGFRALTTLDLITILEGSQKPDRNHPYFAQELEKAKVAVYGPKHKKAGQLKYETPNKQFEAAIEALGTKGEHTRANANTMAEIAALDAKYRKNKNIDLDTELDKIFDKHSQLHTTKSVTGEIDNAGGTTNTSDEKRVMLTEKREDMFTPEGLTAEEFVAQKGAESLFSKSDMIENINLKITNQVPIQGATVMDFDDTIATSKSLIRYTKPDGTKGTLNAEQYAKTYQELTDLGYKWDFSEFNEVVDGKKGPLFDKLKNQIAKYGVDNVYILTARPMAAAKAIQAWLASEGINLPLKNITGLGNSTGEAKADWIENNLILNGFNDIYFVDDANLNVEAVDKMFKTYPEGLLVEGGKSVLVESNLSVSDEFNQMLEENEGVGKEKVYSVAKGKIQGAGKKNFWDLILPPSAYDFELFIYRIIGKGKKRAEDLAWFKKNLFDLYDVAYKNMQDDAQRATDEFRALVKRLPGVKKNLKKLIPGTKFTYEQAVRVSTWNDMGIDMQKMGLSKADQKKLIDAVNSDAALIEYKEGLKNVMPDGYPPPTDYWTTEGIAYDLNQSVNVMSRAKHLANWKKNKDEIFSKENKAKLEGIYGERYMESLENMLYRMEYGSNKKKVSRIESNWNTWVNNSVGAIMFFNFRSATLQTISALNFVDWENNTPYKAAKQFANVKRYRKNFVKILFSNYLKQRRSGSKRTVNEAELTAYLKGKKNPLKAALAWMLDKGFTPTSAADNLAITVGGATYLANQEDFYIAQGKSVAEAERLAFIDFLNKAEKGQQSSRPDLISEQQAGGLGRLILAFKNTQQQYFRIMTKATLDIKNKSGNLKANLSKIAYYGVLQNALFASLQTALFAAFGDDEEWDEKTDRMAQTMIDSILAGTGLTGSIIITVKNGVLEYFDQRKKGFNADHTRTILAFANLSPTIGSKLRRLYSSIRTEQLNQDAIDVMGLDINSPAVNSIASLIAAGTNVPADRVVTITQNLILACKDETEFFDSLALILGWSSWDVGLEPVSRKINQEAKEKRKALLKKLELMEKEQENLKKQKELKDKGSCAGAKKDGKDCSLPVVEGTSFCTVHAKVKERKDGKKVRCKKIKKGGKRCGTMTSAASGLCYYHD